MSPRSARVRRLPVATLAALAALAAALPLETRAHADAPPPTLRAADLSRYEKETLDEAMRARGMQRAIEPEGREIEGIDIDTLEVFEERDPLPHWVNVFHATTRTRVIDREILVRPGQRYTQLAVDESLRNLRRLPQLSLVLAVAVRGSRPGTVRLLVITKDVWSLRLNWNLQAGPGGIEQLTIQPSETNFLGTHQSASALFVLDPGAITLGLGYQVPRLAGTRIAINAGANVDVNRKTGAAEGTYGRLLAYERLFSARSRWGWDASVTWDDVVTRRFVNAREAAFDAKVTPDVVDRIPWEWRTRRYVAQDSVTRSFGWASKHDLSVGGTIDVAAYPTGDLSAYDPRAVAEFQRTNVPRGDRRAGPFLQYHAYATGFIRLHDFETLGLQEDYRLGHDVYARVFASPAVLGSSRDVLGLYAAAQYTVAMGDGLARMSAESTTDLETDRVSDGSVAFALHLVTPRLGFGRLVYDARALSRYRNYLNRTSFLGGNTRLRGYPTSFFVGKDVVTSNLEFRTRPVEIFTSQLGAAVFYDVGDAFDGFDNLRPAQSVGAGLRILFPQLDRLVFRGDLAFPLGAGARLAGVAPVGFFFAFEQAFGVPALTAAALPSGP